MCKYLSGGGILNSNTLVPLQSDKLVSLCIFIVALRGHLLDSCGSLIAQRRKKNKNIMPLIMFHICPIPFSFSHSFRHLSCSHTVFLPQFLVHFFFTKSFIIGLHMVSNEIQRKCLISYTTDTILTEGHGI